MKDWRIWICGVYNLPSGTMADMIESNYGLAILLWRLLIDGLWLVKVPRKELKFVERTGKNEFWCKNVKHTKKHTLLCPRGRRDSNTSFI